MIKELLDGKNAKEKNEIKCRELAKIKVSKFKKKDLDVEIESIEHDGDKLKIIAKAWKDGVELPVSNPLYFINPPILVAKGKKIKIKQSKGTPYEHEVEVNDCEEDGEEAIKEMVMHTIEITCK